MIASTKLKRTEASLYKLYVSPVTNFDKTSLKETFSQYAKVVDVYISEPNKTGFKWGFVYFASEQGLEKTVAKFVETKQYNFKLSRAKPKTMNSIPKTNGVSYTNPLNCVNCRKLTFNVCVSCTNPFCSKECTLDGWRSHTGLCVKIAELVKVPESTREIGNALAPTVVSFMKGCQFTRKKFTSDEFADACNYRSKVNIPLPIILKEEDECNNLPIPNNQLPSHDKGGKMAATLPKPLLLGLNDKEDLRDSTENEKLAKTLSTKYIKCNPASAHKDNRKCFTSDEDNEKNTRCRKQYQEKDQQNSDTENEGSILTQSVNGYRTDHKRSSLVARALTEIDLNLKPGNSLPVVVTSIINSNTFYVANVKKLTEVLREIVDCIERTPQLRNAEINTLCLAFFDGDWYRAKILSNSPIEVEYIDYGNKESCKIEHLKVLPSSLKKYSPLATKVQLREGFVQVFKMKENEEIEIFVHSYNAPRGTWIIDVL